MTKPDKPEPAATRDASLGQRQALTRADYMRITDGGTRPFERAVIQRRSMSGQPGFGLRDAS